MAISCIRVIRVRLLDHIFAICYKYIMLTKRLKRSRMGLRKLFLYVLSVTLVLFGAILIIYSISLQRKILHEELKKRGIALAQSLASSSVLSILRADTPQLRELTHSVTQDPEIVYAEILNLDLIHIARSGRSDQVPAAKKKKLLEIKDLYFERLADKDLYDVFYPILVPGEDDQATKKILIGETSADSEGSIERIIGIARVGISTRALRQKIIGIAVRGVILTLCVVFLAGFFISYFVNTHIIQPLRILTLAAVTASHGDLRQEVDIQTKDEIGVLARAYNLMIHDLRDSQIRYEQSIYKLEDKVKERTQKLEALTDELQEKNKRLKEIGRLKTIFISNVSRELRSPLTAIEGFSSMLMTKGNRLSKEKIKYYLDIIKTETERATSLMQNIADLSRIESGEEDVHAEKIDMGVMIRSIIQELQETYRTVQFTIVGDPSPAFKSDTQKIRRIFEELLSNAARYAGDNGIVRIEIEQDSERMRIHVIDSGPGIEPDEREKIFEKFFRVDNDINRKIPRSGLGLSVASAFVELLGGHLSAHEVEQGGAKFTLELYPEN